MVQVCVVVVTIIYVAAVDILVAEIDVSAPDIGGAKVGKLGVLLGHDSLSKMSIVLRNGREI